MGSSGHLSRGCGCYPKPTHKNEHVFKHSCNKLDVYNWLNDIPLAEGTQAFDCVEVRFKNSRKDFFRDTNNLNLVVGDIVAVESNPGHDIGIVTLTGELVKHQMASKKFNTEKTEIKKIYRRAKATDIEKWVSSVEQEKHTMFKARKNASELNLEMKISDVEYQGDKTKAIFYYTAEERVDFRELIKILAEEFMIRIEMRQIGVRQESSRLGGIGSCGRELCCATWLTQFSSVSTNSARVQQLSLSPQKLAGQCSKLKCCLNYEFDAYQEAVKDFPSTDIVLKTKLGDAIHQKTDIFQGIMWYTYTNDFSNFLAIKVDKVKQIHAINAKGQKIDKLEDYAEQEPEKKSHFENVVGQDDISRFDDKK